MSHTLLITGSSGYVGSMLVAKFIKRPDITKIIGIDKDPESDLTKNLPGEIRDKFVFIQKNLANNTWQQELDNLNVNIVVHCAWQIRRIYGNKGLSYDWNINGSKNLFDLVWKNKIPKLIHFSTVASYGAQKDNSLNNFFKEEDKLRESSYHYAEEKRLVEKILEEKVADAKAKHEWVPQISIIRPASITGPRRKSNSKHFNLQSALSGKLSGSFSNLIKLLTSRVPVTRTWLRQYVHEDDVVGIVDKLAFDKTIAHTYEVFNACPPGDVVLGNDMAQMVGKKVLYVHPQLVRLAFYVIWHATFGRVPTSPGSWLTYCYPIPVDGSKITRNYAYNYKFNTREAFTTPKGNLA
jgi:nucleoside-diphosphate-sugar epimerase